MHFLDAVARDRPVPVTVEQARKVMECTIVADLSAERNEPVNLPFNTDLDGGLTANRTGLECS